MAARSARTSIDPDFIDGGPWIPPHVLRFMLWGGCAAGATLLVVVAAWSQTGSQRLAEARAGDKKAVVSQPAPPAADADTSRLALALRDLAHDRDRLLARVAVLERNLEEVTGSITGSLHPPNRSPSGPGASPLPPSPLLAPISVPPSAAAQSATAITPQIAIAPQATTGPAPSPNSTRQSGASPAPDPSPPAQVHAALTPAARPAPPHVAAAPQSETAVTKTEFGIDLGGEASIEGLRTIWNTLRGNHSALLEGLRPVVAIREGQKPNVLELRLVAGPLANAAAAARYCAALAVSGITCQPTVFDGQRLALR